VLRATRVNQDRRDCKAQAAFPSLAQPEQLVLKANHQRLQDRPEQLDQPEQLDNHLRDHKEIREPRATPENAVELDRLVHLDFLSSAALAQRELKALSGQLDL
jgi:hypothetical protein